MLLNTMEGRDTTAMIMKRRNRQIKMRILNRVCRSDQAGGQNGAPKAADCGARRNS